jgi:hypothetical protein
VTPSDDAFFALELDLLNIERLRIQCSGRFTLLPEQCHAGVDFLLGLGQTIPTLSLHTKQFPAGEIRGQVQAERRRNDNDGDGKDSDSHNH